MMQAETLTEQSGRSASRMLLLLATIAMIIIILTDPSDQIFHLKVPVFVSIMLIWIYRHALSGSTVTRMIWAATLASAIVIPLIWTMVGLLNYGVHSGDSPFGILKAFLFLLLLPVLISEDIDLISLVSRTGIIVAILTVTTVLLSFFSPAIFVTLYAFSIEKQNAMITTSRDFIGLGVGMFYYKTSALMIFPFTYYCNCMVQRGTKWLVPLLMVSVYGTALLFSGTRANLLAVLFVAGMFALGYIRRTFGLVTCLAVATLSVILVSPALVLNLLQPDEQSNSVKLGHLRSYEQEFSANPSILLWGQGTNTAFYSEGYQDWTTITELSYMELVRVFGIPITILFGAGLAWIGYALFTRGSYPVALAYVAYLAIAGSNPLLISSTGFVIICAVWKEAVRPSTADSAFHLSQLYIPQFTSRSVAGSRSISIQLLKEIGH